MRLRFVLGRQAIEGPSTGRIDAPSSQPVQTTRFHHRVPEPGRVDEMATNASMAISSIALNGHIEL